MNVPRVVVRNTLLVLSIIVLLFVVFFAGKLVQNVGADEIVVIQDPIDGDLHWYTSQGLKWQNFGHVTTYKKSSQYWFSSETDQGKDSDQSVRIRFYDGGHAGISGSARWDMPLDSEKLTLIHTKFGSQIAIEQELIRTVFEKAIYMTGPLMSSKESYSEKRNELINYIEDQAKLGVYKTKSTDVRGTDPMTGQEKTFTKVTIIEDPNAPGGRARQEGSPLSEFGIRPYNISLNEVAYDKVVEKQIEAQQEAIMNVQTAIAEAKQAEQRAITAEQEGRANTAKAKWEQEVIKAKAVTEAEQKRDVAKLQKQAAEYTKQEQILLGEGEATRKKLVMSADGALAQKLDAVVKIQQAWAKAWAENSVPITPAVNSGGTGTNSNGADILQQFLQMQVAKSAQDLGLDLNIQQR